MCTHRHTLITHKAPVCVSVPMMSLFVRWYMYSKVETPDHPFNSMVLLAFLFVLFLLLLFVFCSVNSIRRCLPSTGERIC